MSTSHVVRNSYAFAGAVKGGDMNARIQAGARILAGLRSVMNTDGSTAESRILSYLRANARQIIPGTVLEVASGVSDYTRAIRNLRAQGWKIATAGTALSKHERISLREAGITSIPNGSYVLTSRYHRWS